MPELPEVETVRRGLEPAMLGRRIVTAQVNRPDLRWPFPPRMAERLTGQTVTALRRRSKYILVDMSGGETLIVHLGMSGRMLISEASLGRFHKGYPAAAKHDHVVLHMDDGPRITFNDARRFGAMDLVRTDALAGHWLIRDIGPEPLGNGFDERYLIERFQRRNLPVKTALLDQKLVAGLGNIYVCEVLFRAGIHPTKITSTVPVVQIGGLVPIIRDVLQEAIDAGGSSLRDYRQTDGELGYFQHGFRVYDREGQACLAPGCAAVIDRITQSGRSSFFCPHCQR